MKCPKCGEQMIKGERGTTYTDTFTRWYCGECGTWVQVFSSDSATESKIYAIYPPDTKTDATE